MVNELQLKYVKIEENKKEMDLIEQEYIWNEFRPPLQDYDANWNQPPTVDLGDTDTKNKKAFENAVSMFQERSLWISQKIVDRINNIISSQEIENIKYDPLPIANSCCLSKINNEYSYLDFLNNHDTNRDLHSYLDESRNMEYVGSKLEREPPQLVYIVPSIYRKPIRSFKNNIFPSSKQVQKEPKIMKELFSNFIDTGFFQGKKRVYDSNNICSDTGEHKSQVESKAHSSDHFFDLINVIIEVIKLMY